VVTLRVVWPIVLPASLNSAQDDNPAENKTSKVNNFTHETIIFFLNYKALKFNFTIDPNRKLHNIAISLSSDNISQNTLDNKKTAKPCDLQVFKLRRICCGPYHNTACNPQNTRILDLIFLNIPSNYLCHACLAQKTSPDIYQIEMHN
jgi:hypothetical protein